MPRHPVDVIATWANINKTKNILYWNPKIDIEDGIQKTVNWSRIALVAEIIEKYITFDRSLKGSDHPYALTIEEFSRMIKEIRNLEDALGDGVKEPVSGEIPERTNARRSIYSAVKINAGEIISSSMLKIVRHAYGLNPSELKRLIGRKVKVDIDANLPITWDKL